MTENKNNILDFEDPGMLNDELMNVPGCVNELMNHTLAVSPSLLLQCDEADTLLTKRMLYMSQFYVAEGKFDRLKKCAMAFLAKHGGTIDHTTLLRKLKIDAITFKKLILTLEMSVLIESEVGEYVKVKGAVKTGADAYRAVLAHNGLGARAMPSGASYLKSTFGTEGPRYSILSVPSSARVTP